MLAPGFRKGAGHGRRTAELSLPPVAALGQRPRRTTRHLQRRRGRAGLLLRGRVRPLAAVGVGAGALAAVAAAVDATADAGLLATDASAQDPGGAGTGRAR